MALLEKNSTEFHPPINCHFEDLEGKELKAQQEDRDLIVCASGLDVHYRINRLDEESGSSETPELQLFNPRMSSPACPSSYTGKFLTVEDEEDDTSLRDDCIKRSKKIGGKKPYHQKLYEKFEPRKVSKTVVIRDYVCKHSLDVTNISEVAKAVLNEYPDQYIEFLASYVDNMFGEAMKRYLQNTWEKFEMLKKDKEEINRVSWAFYASMHKVGCYNKEGEVDTSEDESPQLPDYTLHWSHDRMKKLIDLNDNGTLNSSNNSCADLIDLIPCLDHHIAVLKEMHSSCKSFATSELHARLMMEYANMQGRNMCDDFELLEEHDAPEYRKVTLKVPLSLYSFTPTKTDAVKDASLDGSIRSSLTCHEDSKLVSTPMFDIPVGYFAGSISSSGLALGSSSKSEMRWGWGHPANVSQLFFNSPANNEYNSVPFYLPLSIGSVAGSDTLDINLNLQKSSITQGVFEDSKWHKLWREKKITKPSQSKNSVSLSSLLEGARSESIHQPYRHVLDFEGANTELINVEGYDLQHKEITKRSVCSSDVNIVNVKPFALNHPILLGEKCIEYDGKKISIPPSYLISPAKIQKDGDLQSRIDNLSSMASDSVMRIIYALKKSSDVFTTVGETERASTADEIDDEHDPAHPLAPVFRSTATAEKTTDELIVQGLKTNKDLKELKEALAGVGSFNRPVSLLPNALFTSSDLLLTKRSKRSAGIYRLKDPKQLKEGRMIDARLNDLNSRDRLICKISFTRYLLQNSFGMNTAALVYEELFSDPELMVLRLLDDIEERFGSLDKKYDGGFKDYAWFAYYMDTYDGGSIPMRSSNASLYSRNRPIRQEELVDVITGLNLGDFLIDKNNQPVTLDHVLSFSSTKQDTIDEVILKVMMTRIVERFTTLLNVTDDTYKDTEKEENLEKSVMMKNFNNLYCRSKLRDDYLRKDAMKILSTAASKEAANAGSTYRETYSWDNDHAVLRNTLLTKALKSVLSYGYLEDFEQYSGSPEKLEEFKYLGEVSDDLIDDDGVSIEIPLGGKDLREASAADEFYDLTNCSQLRKHFGSATGVLYHFMTNESDRMLTSCDTLSYLTRSVSEDGDYLSIKNKAIQTARGGFGSIIDAMGKRGDSLVTTLTEVRGYDPAYLDVLDFDLSKEEQFTSSPCKHICDVSYYVRSIASDLVKPDRSATDEIVNHYLKVLSLLTSYNALLSLYPRVFDEKYCAGTLERSILEHVANRFEKTELEDARNQDTSQPEVEKLYFKYLDVRSRYCATLQSFKQQVLGMVNGKKDASYYMEAMSETNITRAAIKELKKHQVFTSQAFNIMSTMLNDDNFSYKSRYMTKYLDDSSRSEKFSDVYRSGMGVNFKPPHVKVATIDGKEVYEPYNLSRNTVPNLDEKAQQDLKEVNPFKKSHLFTAGTSSDVSPYLDKLHYNDVRSQNGAMLFSMLDAAGFAWNNRRYSTPGDTIRPNMPKLGHQDKMHYWSRILVESFVNAREVHEAAKDASMPWEAAVRLFPDKAFKSSMIGGICERTWKELFPLLPKNHSLRSKLERVRSLSVLWYELNGYKVVKNHSESFSRSDKGAWIPMPVSHQMHFYKRVGLFDEKSQIPSNPWTAREDDSAGLSKIFNQSYHSPWAMAPDSAYFKDWVKTACKYQTTEKDEFRPFSQYGGHPVQADFVHHLVQKSTSDKKLEKIHSHMVEQRFGNIDPIRMGKLFKDTGLLQNMFSWKYSMTSKVDKKHRDKFTDEVRISNFLAYARVHTIMALGSCNPGTQEMSTTLATRNFFRLHVDTYNCAGKERNSDGVPVILGYKSIENAKPDEPSILFIAGTMNCINNQLSNFCSSSSNSNGKVCPMYKQLYFNDATLLFEKLLRQERTRHRHAKNYARVRAKDPTYTLEQFDRYMLDLKEEHISFLQHVIIGMLQKLGMTDKELPFGILEPRDFYVDPTESQDTNLIGNDYLSPALLEDMEGIDFGSDEIDYDQLAVLSLTPPDVRAVAMYKITDPPGEIDTEYLQSQMQKKVVKDNKNVWADYAKKVVQAGLGVQWLEAHQVSLAFDPDQFKNPVDESMKIGLKKSGSMKNRDSVTSMMNRSEMLRKNKSSSSAQSRLKVESEDALSKLDDEISKAVERNGSSKLTELASRSDVPDQIKRKLARLYMSG